MVFENFEEEDSKNKVSVVLTARERAALDEMFLAIASHDCNRVTQVYKWIYKLCKEFNIDIEK